MANLTETSTFEESIYQLDVLDPVQGGADGVDNLPHKQLANRTKYLKAFAEEVETARGGEGTLDARLDGIDEDIAAVGIEVMNARGGEETLDARLDGIDVDIAEMEASLSNGSALWVSESATVARVAAKQFSVLGDKRSLYHEGRAVFLDQDTDAYGHVSGSTYSSGDDLTTVTIIGATVDTGLSAIRYGQAVNNAPRFAEDMGYIGESTGSSNAFFLTLTPAHDAYVEGQSFAFKANHTNTGVASLNVSSLGAVAIKKNVSDDLAAGDIQSGRIIIVIYDGTYFQLITAAKDSSVPVGAMIKWPTETPPDGWLARDGSELSRTTYADLYAVLGTTYGVGDGSTTFDLMDDRGLFERNWDNGAGVDPDASSRTDRGDGTTGDHVGTKQADDYKKHASHILAGGSQNFGASGSLTYGNMPATGGNETRPKNRAYLPIIKY